MSIDTSLSMTAIGPMAALRSAGSASRQSHDGAVSDFLAEVKKSPIERIQEAILKKHGLTKEQFDRLPPDQRVRDPEGDRGGDEAEDGLREHGRRRRRAPASSSGPLGDPREDEPISALRNRASIPSRTVRGRSGVT